MRQKKKIHILFKETRKITGLPVVTQVEGAHPETLSRCLKEPMAASSVLFYTDRLRMKFVHQ